MILKQFSKVKCHNSVNKKTTSFDKWSSWPEYTGESVLCETDSRASRGTKQNILKCLKQLYFVSSAVETNPNHLQ